jgi:enoyl-CoA hydratase/carnithine racemase
MPETHVVFVTTPIYSVIETITTVDEEHAAAMSEDIVKLRIEDGVATATLNDPDRRNALSEELANGLRGALEEVERSDARCLVIEGAGEAFSAGGDISSMVEAIENDVPIDDRVDGLLESTNDVMRQLGEFSLPTIAKVDGAAVGAGGNMAILCDIQIASDRAAIGFVFRQVGLGVDTGTSYRLPRLVGENVAKELVFTGRIVDAEEAADLGLFNHVFPAAEFDEKADEIIDSIASGPTVALKHAKRLIDEGSNKSLDQAMIDEAVAQGIIFETDDHEEGVQAFLNNRSPEFEGQ